MKKSGSFPGIAPKVEFATASIMEESDWNNKQPASPPHSPSPERQSPSPPRPSSAKSPSSPRSKPSSHQSPSSRQQAKRNDGNCSHPRSKTAVTHGDVRATDVTSSSSPGPSPSTRRSQRRRKEGLKTGPGESGYQQSTVASRTRALSPYTHRRMCQLSEEARQRLSHLQLGPHRFRKETERQPPFLVSNCSRSSVVETFSPSHLSSPRTSSLRHCHSASYTADCTDPSLQGSYRPRAHRLGSGSMGTRSSPGGSSGHGAQIRAPVGGSLSAHCDPGSSNLGSSPLLSRSSLRERFHSQYSPSQWQQIHSRVQMLLQTHGTNGTSPAKSSRSGEPPDLPDHSDIAKDSHGDGLQRTSVRLEDGAHWSSQASPSTGRTHRAVFEDSLGKIYRNMYRQTCSSSE